MSKPSPYRLLCTLLAIFSFGLSFGQSDIIIKGLVTDKDSHEELIFANVMLIDANGEIIAWTTTDIEGRYTLVVTLNKLDRKGQLSLRVSYLAYVEEIVDVNPKPGVVYLKNLELKPRYYGIPPLISIYEPWVFPMYSGEVFDQDDIKTNYRQ